MGTCNKGWSKTLDWTLNIILVHRNILKKAHAEIFHKITGLSVSCKFEITDLFPLIFAAMLRDQPSIRPQLEDINLNLTQDGDILSILSHV